MACQIKELAEYILANYDEKSKVWRDINSVLNTEKNSAEITTSVVNIKGYEIKFHTVPKGSIKNIASTNSHTQEIRLQEGITAVDVAEYLRSENTPETRLKVLKILKNKYEVDFNVLLRNMQNSPQLLRKFLLLHEYRHLQQIIKRDSAEEFNRDYKKDPVKFELDADLFALRTLREEIEIIAPYIDLTLQAYEEVLVDGVSAIQMSDKITKDGPELSSEYVKLFKKGTEQFIEATMKIDNEVMLEALRNDVNSVVPADYNKDSKIIRMIDSEIDEKALVEAMQDSYDDAKIEKIIERNPEQERLLQIMIKRFKNSPRLDNLIEMSALKQTINKVLTSEEYTKTKKEYIEDRAKQLVEYAKGLDRGHAEVHELVHAAAYKFMLTEQTEPRAKAIQERINLLFEEAKKMAGYSGSKVHDPYWTQNVHEFIAEALSNPEVIRKLEAMPIQNKLGRLSTVLRALVDALVSIVSTSKNKDSVYAYTMDGLMALMEVQKEQQKQEVDIIQPSEVFTKNINKMMKC